MLGLFLSFLKIDPCKKPTDDETSHAEFDGSFCVPILAE